MNILLVWCQQGVVSLQTEQKAATLAALTLWLNSITVLLAALLLRSCLIPHGTGTH